MKRTKYTDRHQTLAGTDWPIMHVLDGNETRGYTVSENVCGGDSSITRRRNFDTLAEAQTYFETLDGGEQ